jgi:photosystem II stability/assembly factor-like uncharacterized protein
VKGGIKTFKRELILPILAVASLLDAIDCTCAQSWTLQTNAPPNGWTSVCCSSDGSKIAAVNGTLYVSTNSGISWVTPGNTNSQDWTSIACSADGTKFAVVSNSRAIYISADSGASWQAQTNVVFPYPIESIVSSADGNTLLAGRDATVGGALYYSTNGGLAWATNNMPNDGWTSVACSKDGTILAAASYFDVIYVSTNSGGIWTFNPPAEPWVTIALSADGSTLAAAGNDTHIYVTTDLGVTWKTNNSPVKSWESVALSADGSRMVAGAGGGLIYTSTDFGVNWVSNNAPSILWRSLASSADGSKLVAVSYGSNGGIYTWQAIPSLNLAVTNGGCLLSWPYLSSTTNYGLQQISDLTTTNWAAVTNQPGVTNGHYQVMLPAQSGNQFYQLLQGQ